MPLKKIGKKIYRTLDPRPRTLGLDMEPSTLDQKIDSVQSKNFPGENAPAPEIARFSDQQSPDTKAVNKTLGSSQLLLCPMGVI